MKKLDRHVLIILVASLFPYVAVVSLNVTYPSFFNLLKDVDSAQFYAALSIPYGAGALLASYLHKKEASNFESFFRLHSIVFSLSLIIGAIIKSVYFTYIVLFIIAYCHASIRIHRNTFIMRYVNNENIGKALSFFEMIFTINVVITSLLLGLICDSYSPIWSWIIIALTFLMIILISGIKRKN